MVYLPSGNRLKKTSPLHVGRVQAVSLPAVSWQRQTELSWFLCVTDS